MARTKSNQIDWSTFGLNIKRAKNTSSSNPGNGVNSDFAGLGAAVTFTVETACNAFVTVHVGCNSTSEFELKPQIYLDGAVHTTSDVGASISGTATNRFFQRSVSNVVALSAGAHTISAGITVSSATSQSVPIGSAEVIAIVLGRVTA